MPLCTKMRALPAIAVILAMACLGRVASGAIFLVTQIGDSGPGSLRQAMLDANGAPGPDTIQFNLGVIVSPPVFINLLSPLPDIVGDVMIVGPGPSQVIVQRDLLTNPGPFSIFRITGNRTAEIRGLAITRGGAAQGAGIFAEAGSLTVVDCLLFQNTASNVGGGIAMIGAGNCTLNVTNATVFSNTATMQGGGVAVVRTSGIATVTLNGATVERSNVNGIGLGNAGGGLYVAGGTGPHVVNITASTINDGAIASGGMGGGAFVDARGGTLTLLNSTISGNGSAEGAALAFANATTTIRNCTIFTNNSTSSTTIGVIADLSGAGMTVRNTIISGNSSGGLLRDLAAGQAATGNNNLIGVGGPFVNGVNGNIVGVTNPGLVPLNTNGGPTMTYSLRPESPALDAGSNADAPATDQRGQMRPSDGDNNGVAVADIGAFETQRYLVTTTANSGVGSLRQAILDNNTAGGGFIKFAIMMIGQAKTITPKSPLPVIMRTACIDGWSQGGQTYQGPPLVEIDGIMVADTIGLDIQWSDCIVRGLAVNRFSNFGIGIKISSRSGLRNWIYGCYVGVGLDGTTPKGNGQAGVWIAPSANSNLIGTNADNVIDAMERNVISGSNVAGFIRSGVYIESNSNAVAGNNIGTDVTGMVAIPNGNGVWVSAGSQNQIGTNTLSANPLGERNIIAGNANVGAAFTSQGANNFVSGNHIGVNTPGTAALPNLLGVTLDNVNRTLIGGTSAGERNVISGNLQQGVVISGTGAFSNLVQGNHIGTNAAGGAAIGNGLGGVLVRAGAVFNRIGAFGDNSPLEAGRRNVISGNSGPGVVLQDQNSNDNRVMGNYIGVGANGVTAMGNSATGVSILDSPTNQVGAPGSGRNVIARQTSAVNGDGVVVSGVNALNNKIRNNFIGVAADGSAAPNAGAGLTIFGGALLTSVGGINVGEGNVIANNGGPGVKVLGDDTLANSILGNSIVGNGGLGIDLKNDGVTPNGPANVVRIGPNNLQNYPVITATNSGGVITATLTAIGDTTYRVEFFSNVSPDPSGHGEGRTFLGSRNVTTDASGVGGPFVFNAAVPPGEEFISATATELAPLTGIIRGFPTIPGQPLGTSEFAFTRRLNTEPTTENQVVNTLEDTDATITLTATDPDPGATFTFTIRTIPTAGQLRQFGTLTPITVAGTAVSDSGGRVIFRPAPNDFGSPYAFFDFIANDGAADSNQSTVTVNVLPVNDPPSFVAVNPSPVLEDVGPVVVSPWVTAFSPGPANESGQTVLAYLVSGITNPGLFTAGGQPTVDTAGVLRYTPAPDQFGSSQFTVRVQDNGGTANGGIDTSPPQTFTIVVGPVNDAPSFVATNPPPVLEDVGAVVVSPWVTAFSPGPANESTQTVLAYLVSAITNPTLFAPGGAPTVDIGGTLRYTPAADAFGSSQFTVRVQDSGGTANGGVDLSVPQTFTIVVGPVNDAPSFVATNPPPVLEDVGPVVVNPWVTAFSPGPANESTQTVLAYLVSAITNPALFTAGGQPTVDNAGVLRYTPAPDQFGSSQFTVRVQDNGGTVNGGVDLSPPQTFTIVVGPVNDPPSFVAADPPPVLEDVGPVVVSPWVTAFSPGPANESGQTVLAYLVSGITNPGLFTVGGQPTVDNAGVLRYTPAPDQFGSSQFTVRVQDNGGTANGGVDTSPPQTFTIVVGPVNDPPSFVAADPPPVLEDSGLATVVNWASGFSPGPANESTQTNLGYQVSAITNPGLFAPGGAPSVDIGGTLRYTPAADAFGSSQFTVRVQDSGGTANGGIDLSAPQTFTIVVGPVNDPPTFVAADPPTVLEDVGPVVVSPWVTAFSPGPANESTQTVLAYLVSAITNPTLFAAGGAPTVDTAGVLRYTPAADEFGTSQFTLRVRDSGGTANGGIDLSAPQMFTITVLPVNDQPSFTAADPPAVLEDSGPATVSGWVQSFSPGPANESTQTVLAYLVSGIGNPGLFAPGGLPVVDNAGTLRYTPATDVSGTSLFTVRVRDNGGTANGGIDTSAPLNFTIRVGPVNDPPSFMAANPPPVLEDSGLATVVNWATNFVPGPPDEAGQVVLAYIVSGVTNPSLFAAGGAPTVDNAGTLRYTPAPDEFGVSMFTVVVRDDGGTANGGVDTSPPQTFMIVVFPVNDPPSFVAMDPPPVLEDSGQATVANWASGFNPGPANEAGQANLGYTVSGVTNAGLFTAGGQPTVDITGTLRYTPAPDANGSSQFTVVVRDDGGTVNGGMDTSTPRTFTIRVGPVNDPPSFQAANPPPVLEDSGSATVAGWVTNFVPGPPDEAGQTVLSYTVSGVTNPGLFSTPPAVSNAGTLTYTPAADEFGTSQFTVVVRDSGGTDNGGVDTSSPRTFTITVLPVNDKPAFTAVNPPAVLESTGNHTVGGFIASFNPGPANEAGQTIAGVVVDQVSNPGLFSLGPTVNAGGTLSYSLSGVGFGTSTFRVRVRDSGGTANGGVDLSDPQVFAIIVRPKAVCINVTIDARTVCLDLTVQPSQINGTPNTPGPGATQSIEFSRPLNVAFPLGVTPVTVTARYSDGLVSSCVARVTVLFNDCNVNNIPDSCEFLLGQLQDCNGDGIPDECQCVWDQGSVPSSGAATANGFLSHYGSGSIINKAADDFYLCPDRVYRIFSFSGQMITNSVLHKAVLEIYEDCDGKPAGEPFKRYTNSVAIGAVPAGVGFQMVTYSFDLCSDCLVLEGGKNYWVSLVGLTDFTGNDSSYWVTTSNVPDPLHVMGLPPLKRTGFGGPPPYPQMYQPWTGAEQCCGGCVNLAWKMTGEACINAWDNGSIDLNAGAGGTAGGTRSELDVGSSLGARAADDFVLRGCGVADVCYLETWVWTNCNPVHGFAEVYTNECQKPGFTAIRSARTTKVEAIAGVTLLHNGLTLYPYRLTFCNPGWTLDATKNYWLSSGAETSGSVGGRALFAFAGRGCRDACQDLKLNPGRFLDPLSQPLAWVDTGRPYAFRLFIKDEARPFPAGPLPSATPTCPVDFNHDANVNVQDIFAFLSAWFAACP